MVKSGGAHDLAVISHNGLIVATFGIRRASEKDKGHDYIPKEIFVNMGFAKALGKCTKYKPEWIQRLQADGKIPPDDPPSVKADPPEA